MNCIVKSASVIFLQRVRILYSSHIIFILLLFFKNTVSHFFTRTKKFFIIFYFRVCHTGQWSGDARRRLPARLFFSSDCRRARAPDDRPLEKKATAPTGRRRRFRSIAFASNRQPSPRSKPRCSSSHTANFLSTPMTPSPSRTYLPLFDALKNFLKCTQ